MSFLALRDVHKRYASASGPVVALEELSFTAARGEFVVLLGPSGCGKSTCLRLVAGLESPSAGSVSLDGHPIVGCAPDRTLIFQRPSLFPWLSALENVAFGLHMQGMDPRERLAIAGDALARMDLTAAADRYPHQLSGGMQQRVALARALILAPAVVLMDEPLGAVDALLRSRLQVQIHQACAGRTVLFVTHSIREALVLADRILIMTPQPGRVRHELAPPGRPPRAPSPDLWALEADIEAELTQEIDASP